MNVTSKTLSVTVNVKHEHLWKGQEDSCERCPIALALWDLGFQPHVYNEEVDAWQGPRLYRADLPEEAVSFISGFDQGKSCKPFYFALEFREIG